MWPRRSGASSAQTRPPIECLVIDDGSTDATAESCGSSVATLPTCGRTGPGVSAARNRGAGLAQRRWWRSSTMTTCGCRQSLSASSRRSRTRARRSRYARWTSSTNEGRSAAPCAFVHARDLITGMLTFDGTETVSCSSAGLIRREQLLGWAASTLPCRCRPTGTSVPDALARRPRLRR